MIRVADPQALPRVISSIQPDDECIAPLRQLVWQNQRAPVQNPCTRRPGCGGRQAGARLTVVLGDEAALPIQQMQEDLVAYRQHCVRAPVQLQRQPVTRLQALRAARLDATA